MEKLKLSRENVKFMAEATISGIWSCIDWDKVDARRAYGIWDEFASKIKASALTTNNYEKFVEKLARKMGVRSLRYKDINTAHEQSEEFKKAILKMIREETLQLVLQVRLNNEERKEMKKALKRQEEQQKRNENRKGQVNFTEKGLNVNE